MRLPKSEKVQTFLLVDLPMSLTLEVVMSATGARSSRAFFLQKQLI